MPEIIAKIVDKRSGNRLFLIISVTAFVSVLVALLAIFNLGGWAETSAVHHGIQHILIFTSGAGFGTALINTRKLKQEESHDR